MQFYCQIVCFVLEEKMYQRQLQELRPLTSAHLAQTMTMLEMSAEEIREKVESELSKNPALELIEDRICPVCKRKLPENGKCPYCSCPKSENPHDNIIFVSPRDDFTQKRGISSIKSYQDEPEYDSAQQDDLATYVLRQIGPDLAEDQKRIAAFLLNSLDEDGFITTDILEISQYYHVRPSEVQEVIDLIQRADPIGVGSRNPKEALQSQINHLKDYMPIPLHTEEIIKNSYELLMHGHNKEIAKDYNLSIRQVEKIEKFIGENLNPFPARAHWGEKAVPNNRDLDVFHYPDILIYYLDESENSPLVVEVIMPISGYLQVSQLFKKALKNAPEEKQTEWKNDIDKASLLVKCLDQRNNTMVRLMEYLILHQADYIRFGAEKIFPLTRAIVAKDLGVHESTISRAVSHKTVMLPNRKVIPLASFFDRSLNVRTIIKELVRKEEKPLTDAKIVDMLSNMGYDIARRTVAKYRAMEGILPAHLRNNISVR